jgi:hypothetical protein
LHAASYSRAAAASGLSATSVRPGNCRQSSKPRGSKAR